MAGQAARGIMSLEDRTRAAGSATMAQTSIPRGLLLVVDDVVGGATLVVSRVKVDRCGGWKMRALVKCRAMPGQQVAQTMLGRCRGSKAASANTKQLLLLRVKVGVWNSESGMHQRAEGESDFVIKLGAVWPCSQPCGFQVGCSAVGVQRTRLAGRRDCVALEKGERRSPQWVPSQGSRKLATAGPFKCASGPTSCMRIKQASNLSRLNSLMRHSSLRLA